MATDVLVPGARDVRATLDGSEDGRCVVACPPHPRYGGSRSDARLRTVSSALDGRGIACLRFDYGPWDGGEGERSDAVRAVEWACERFHAVGLFGYSFGGGVALMAAPAVEATAVSVLAPVSSLGSDLDAAANVEAIDAPIHVVYGERDTTADWEPVVERARSRGATVVGVSADHFFTGRMDEVSEHVGTFMDRHLR